MEKITITEGQAIDLLFQMRVAKEPLDAIAPNGKKLIECTGDYVAAIEEALAKMGVAMTGTN